MNWHSSSNSTIANEKEDVMSKDACSFNLIMSLCLSIIKCIKFITLCIHRMARASLGRHFAFRSRFCLLLSGMCAMCVCRQSWSQPHAGYTRSIVYSICSSHRSVSMSPQILYGTRERLVLQTQTWGHRRYSSKGSVSGGSRATRKAPYLSYIVPSHSTHTHTHNMILRYTWGSLNGGARCVSGTIENIVYILSSSPPYPHSTIHVQHARRFPCYWRKIHGPCLHTAVDTAWNASIKGIFVTIILMRIRFNHMLRLYLLPHVYRICINTWAHALHNKRGATIFGLLWRGWVSNTERIEERVRPKKKTNTTQHTMCKASNDDVKKVHSQRTNLLLLLFIFFENMKNICIDNKFPLLLIVLYYFCFPCLCVYMCADADGRTQQIHLRSHAKFLHTVLRA